jgi:two-component system phosphate regulon response regulator PhoB
LRRPAEAPAANGKVVLLADDEPDVIHMVESHLSKAGYKVLKCADGHEALNIIQSQMPHLAVLDMMMPEMSGLEVCKVLRADPRTAKLPIIILTARTTEVDRVLSFELGADDFVPKPFSPRELVLRIASILRRSQPETTKTTAFLNLGDIALDPQRHEVTVSGRFLALTAIEFKLLLTLMQNKGRTLSRATIIETVWGFGTDVGFRTVDTHMRRLREKLGSAAKQIHTLRGFGYRLD